VDNFDGIDVLVGFTGSTFEQNNEVSASNDGKNERFFSWQAGVQATYLGITAGGGYVDYDEARGLTDAFHLGAEYTNGPVTFGGAYARVQAETPAGNESVGNLYGVAVTYKVAPGVSVLGDLMFLSTDVDNANDAVFGAANGQEADFTVLAIFGVKVAF
jgi:predicted porin